MRNRVKGKSGGIRLHDGQIRYLAKVLGITISEVTVTSLKDYVKNLDAEFPADLARGGNRKK